MPSSHTPNVELSILSDLLTTLQAFKQSVSLDESCTLMEEFIFIVSSISTGSSLLEQQQFLMWEAATLTSRSLEGLLRRDTTMRSKMATWLREDSPVPHTAAEMALTRLILSGLQSSWLKTVMSFGVFATSWFRNTWHEASLVYPNMPTGSLHPRILSTIHPTELALTRQELRESTSGSCRLVWDLEQLDAGEFQIYRVRFEFSVFGPSAV